VAEKPHYVVVKFDKFTAA